MVNLKIKLPDDFLNEEVRNGYVVSSQMKEVWAVELDLLVEFDRVCKEIGVKYFLDSGTLLGAVRNKGFIPWDDDIDVSMFREDYDRLVQIAPSKFKYPYFFQCAYTDEGYYRFHAQLRNSETTGMLPNEKECVVFNQGIFIDIFVLDGLANEEGKYYRQIMKLRFYRLIFACRYFPNSDRKSHYLIKKWIGIILKAFKLDLIKLYIKSEKIIKQFDGSDNVDLICLRLNPRWHRNFRKEWYLSTIEVKFEGFSFPAPIGYESVLIEYYGRDYMIPKNVPTLHAIGGNIIFDTNKSYKEVIASYKK